MKDVGNFFWPFGIFSCYFIFYDRLKYFVAIWNILWSFWYIFSSFGMLYQEQFDNPEMGM
jgi:hypothetical protein